MNISLTINLILHIISLVSILFCLIMSIIKSEDNSSIAWATAFCWCIISFINSL